MFRLAVFFARALAAAAVSLALVGSAWVGSTFADRDPGARLVPQRADISGDPARPRRHFRVRNPAALTPEEAARIYTEISDEMAAGYAMSGDPAARAYRRWRRYNRAPYRSASHGRRFLNNYVNTAGAAYGRFEQAGRLPIGTVIAKDSFAVTTNGTARPGPLFLMEKMSADFNYVSGDWRYTMIMPDGSIYGTSKGAGAERVEYCIACHLAREAYDHLFFVPKDVRHLGE